MKDILQQLQKRIDQRSNLITYMETYLKDNPDGYWQADNEDQLVEFRSEQVLDKRLYAHIVSLRRECKAFCMFGEV